MWEFAKLGISGNVGYRLDDRCRAMWELNDHPNVRGSEAPYIVNYGPRIWTDGNDFTRVFGLRGIGGDLVCYRDASIRYDYPSTFRYRFHWLIDSSGHLYRFENLRTDRHWGRALGWQRVIARILPKERILVSTFIELLSHVENDDEYNDERDLLAAVSKLPPDNVLNKSNLEFYFHSQDRNNHT